METWLVQAKINKARLDAGRYYRAAADRMRLKRRRAPIGI